MKSLKALVKKAKRGDGEAFVSLVKQYEDVLYRTASRLLNNDEDVADAMQEAIISAYERLHTLKNDEYFNTWICKILINKCNSLLNKNKSFSTVDVHVLPDQNNDDFQKIELEDALNSLNKDYRLAFILYYIVGLNIREMSEFLKEPEGTIKSRLSRGKSILRNNYYRKEAIVNEY
ncbi:RNA polymerase sigma factor [Lederbergia citrea]|uniref:Sigma-70 family RNA polymerase sigma factor n=1 Tax=Lederbergia citrea TaxID=2833581 RepID=A0A942Z6M8_9BACI|nr:sigma-70 family RNA polymerase sigma factor [Lederbergia citrea]MBS4179426.1 sigma-70 family RNA polymerase sigma factor [Lederbergia citrea]MBS4206094.1 sigma-70 family RNA polymerase sigma factor [Lederbergia citrea]MBS4224457.1 sigma-70 family RNA polymerase sigma factor [Lederbergia citrea]